DIAAVQQYLKTLEQQIAIGGGGEIAGARNSDRTTRSGARWGPLDIDEVVPTVRSGITCPLPQILDQTSRRIQDFIDNLQRFSANESIHQIDIGKNGKSHGGDTQIVNYVAQIEQNSSGYPSVTEYRYSASGVRRQSLLDTGTAAFALIFHPVHIATFIFRCEGLSDLRGLPAWQLHFEERPDSNKSFHAIKIGNSIYLPKFKGRAWIAVDSYDVRRIETDLVSPILEINLEREHLVISYAPVEFEKHRVQLWLPENASVYLVFRGHQYERLHNFSDFQLFSVDSEQAIKAPPEAEQRFSQWALRK